MQRKTFNDVLNQTAAANRESLMRKARNANQLAKITKGISRRRFYRVKHDALKSLVHKFNADTSVRLDLNAPKMLVVTVDDARFGLHAPQVLFPNLSEAQFTH